MALTKATQNVLEGVVSTGSTGVSAGSFIVAQQYKITSLGTTTQSQWNTIAGTTGQTYVVGSLFTAATIGASSGNGAAAVARTLANRFADVVNVKDFGAVGDGVADDTAAIQAAISALVFGGTLFIPSDARCLISSPITIPKGCSIASDSTGWKGYANNRGNDGNPDFYDISPAIHFSGTAKIILQSAASIANLLLIRTGMLFPITYTAASAWTGNCIEATGASSNAVLNCTIFGFRTGIISTGSRMLIQNNNFDCWNGMDISNNFDVGMISNNHMWPFLTAYWVPVASYNDLKRNVAFNLHDTSDWTQLSNNFCYGYLIGYRLVSVGAIAMVNCAADNIPPTILGYHVNSIGFYLDTAKGISLTNCRAAAQSTGLNIINSVDINVVCSSFWANVLHGILFSSGQANIADSNIESITGGNGSGITYADTSSAGRLSITNVRFAGYSGSSIPVNINNNVNTNNFSTSNLLFESCSSPAIRGVASLSLAAVPSASNVILPANGINFFITGNTNIGNFITETWTGREINLIFEQPLTIVNSVSVKLSGGVNFVTTANTSLSMIYTSGAWVETARSTK